MKTLFITGLTVLIATSATAQVGIGGLMGVDTSYRIHRGERPTESTTSEPRQMSYKVLDVTKEGCRVWSDFYEADLFIYGIDGYSDRHYTSYIVPIGSYSYITVNGATRKIPAYKVVSDQDVATRALAARERAQAAKAEKDKADQEQMKRDRERQAWYNKAIEEQNKTTKRMVSMRVFEFRKEQATNGLPTAQYQVGKAYLDGENCPTNKTLGVYWLTKSAEQGNADAKAALDELK